MEVVNTDDDPVAWLRQRIKERLYLARHAIELGNAAEWTELSSGVLMTIAPDAPQDRWDGVHPMGDSSLTRLMEANDPQDTIARCEAELAILDLLAAANVRKAAAQDEYDAWVRDSADPRLRPMFGVGSPNESLGPSAHLIPGLECAVRLLVGGYKSRPGYRQEWKP